jgi:hypothetical protein
LVDYGVVSAVVVGGAVVAGAVVTGTVLAGAIVVGAGEVVDGAAASDATGAEVSVVETFVRRVLVVVVDEASIAIGTVELAGVLLETLDSVRARPKRNAPTATVMTSAAMNSVVSA